MIRALPNLALTVIHERTAENKYLILVDAGRVAAAALQPINVIVLHGVILATPVRQGIFEVVARAGGDAGDLLVRVVVLAADEIALIANRDHCRVLTRRWEPTSHLDLGELDEE